MKTGKKISVSVIKDTLGSIVNTLIVRIIVGVPLKEFAMKKIPNAHAK
jgi:hypothetical protein